MLSISYCFKPLSSISKIGLRRIGYVPAQRQQLSVRDNMAPVPQYTTTPSEVSLLGGNSKIPASLYQMRLIEEAMLDRIGDIDPRNCDSEQLDPFFVCDLGELKRLVRNWQERLPRIGIFYAVKCNNDLNLLKTIANLGLGFDCASKNEIQSILDLGITSSRIIYSNPCKSIPYIRYSRDVKVDLTTVDNLDELQKIKEFHPDCGLLIRILTDDSTSTCPLSVKFGASIDYAKSLVDSCKDLDLNLRGIAFHVGSGCKDFKTIRTAVADCKTIYEYAELKGIRMDSIDVGGGFEQETFKLSSEVLRSAIEDYFPQSEYPNMNLIAELGRYLSSSCFTLAAHVTSKRSDMFKERIYLSDGIYGNFNCILYDHQVVEPRVLTSKGEFKFEEDYFDINTISNSKEYSIWGPTCDGLDCIKEKCRLSSEVDTGDWLYFKNIGAYTSVASTSFNGFTSEMECIYVDSEQRHL
ncbi:DEKNAAC105519 [Brettanomyces naardenensis]|uniref:ornithine decarboxylase n=1 Tax=Brettanomyces naardenensis TaxID=13370 RepID=A0A448YTW1_BRENA|nr:DEKNAAC105519 [Brettanomyces naardenensis]